MEKLPIPTIERIELTKEWKGVFQSNPDYLPKSQRNILTDLALKGPNPAKLQTKYQIEKDTAINHASICEAIDKLALKGPNQALIGENIGETRCRKQSVKYNLTLYGVWAAIVNSDSKHYCEIAKEWEQSAPKLLGKYPYLFKYAGEKNANAFLHHIAVLGISEPDLNQDDLGIFAISIFLDHIRGMIEFIEIKDDSNPSHVKFHKEVYWGIENPVPFLDVWLRIFKGDPDLNKYLDTCLEDFFLSAEHELSWSNFLKQKMQTIGGDKHD